MRKILILFLTLTTVFFFTWGVKARMPINRPDSLQEESESAWYNSKYTAPKADDDWKLDPEIPDNYVPVAGQDELYMVVDDSGKIIKYRKRIKQADGSWLWKDVNPDIPDNYTPVKGLKDVYKVTDKDGKVRYVKYIRNDDDTYAFVECDKNGNPIDDGENAEKIDKNHVHVKDNVYAKYNDHGVLVGYRKRVKDGNKYIWKVTGKPNISNKVGNGRSYTPSGYSGNRGNSGGYGQYGQSANNNYTGLGSETKKQKNSDGSYTETSNSVDTVEKNGFIINYTTKIIKKYDSRGNLISTKKEGPYQTSRKKAGASSSPNRSLIASSLDGEYARVTAKTSMDTATAKEILTKLNAQRASAGQSPFTMTADSDAYKLAAIKAADMAQYNYASSRSPMYGNASQMASRFNVECSDISQNIWRASSSKTASQIHSRFQSSESSRNLRMRAHKGYGVAVAKSGSNIYIAEVFLD